jgi:hypothetical protein
LFKDIIDRCPNLQLRQDGSDHVLHRLGDR